MTEAVFSVRWKDHSCELATVYKSLLENNFLVDCTISAEGQSLKAHRLVLSACSPYFQKLFREESGRHPCIVFVDASFATLKAVIDFMYLGETSIPEGNLKAFLILSQSLQIKGLDAISKRKKKHSLSSSTTGNAPQETFDNQNTREDKSTSANLKDSLENYSKQPPYLSQDYSDAAVSSVPVEGFSASCERVPSPLEDHGPVECNGVLVDPEMVTVKHEPSFAAFPETRNEILDNIESDEPISETFTNETLRGTASAYGEQHLNQFSIPKREHLGDERSREPINDPDIPENNSSDTDEVTQTAHADQNNDEFSRAAHLPPEGDLASQPWSHQSQGTESQRMQPDPLVYENSQEYILPSSLVHLPSTSSSHNPAGAGKPTYVCDLCGATFNWPSHLVIHRRKHTGERPYSCKVCGKTFTQKPSVVRHMRTHTGERPFICSVCGKAYGQAWHLTYHRMHKHSGESPYQCELCGKTLSDPSDLRRHKQSGCKW